MRKDDELQYMPMRSRVRYTDEEYKRTNIKNHGVKKGTVKWNHKKFVTTLVLTGSIFAVSMGGIHAFNTMKGAPKEIVATIDNDETKDIVVNEVPEVVNRVIVDYKVRPGDTLDGIIYKYTESASEKDYYKNYVKSYNNIDDEDRIQMDQIITLVGVPEKYADELNTGYNESYNKDDDVSVELNGAVEEMLDEVGRDYPKGSLADTIVRELEVYNNTTNSKTRSYLAKTMLYQIGNVRDYGNDPGIHNDGKSR